MCLSATSSEGATNNAQPLSNNVHSQATTTYEPLRVDTQRPVSYQQLPSKTGQQQDYYNVDNP